MEPTLARKPPPVKQLIIQKARKYGVDPAAAIAVARGEGGLRWGAVGDQGTSHGPFQLRVGGANPYTGERARRFANSAAGVDYAIRKMAESGARGLKGEAAVNAIVRRFERPADPDTSVRNAVARLGSSATPLAANAAAPGKLRMPVQPRASAIPTQAAGTLNDIFKRVGLAPLDIVGDLPLPTPRVSGRATPALGAAPPALPPPLKAGKMPRVNRMVSVIQYAQQLGLSVRENPYTDSVQPVHVKNSHHYQTIGTYKGKKVGKAMDVSGDPKALRQFWAYAEGFADDMFWDPMGFSIDRGKRWDKTIGGHGNHLHFSLR